MRRTAWINLTVIGIVLATFLSDFSHEMCTAVLPFYLSTLGFGPAALGLIEGVADFLVSLSKLAGGVVGHHVERKRPWTTLGYLTTTWRRAPLHSSVGWRLWSRSAVSPGPGEDSADPSGTTCWRTPWNLRISDVPMDSNGPATCSARWPDRLWQLCWCGAGWSSIR